MNNTREKFDRSPPLVRGWRLDNLRATNKDLSERLSFYDDMLPFLALAQSVKEKILEGVARFTNDEAEWSLIGEVAFKAVLDAELENARSDLAKRYENEHRASLLERIRLEVESAEGPNIWDEARTRIETNPEIMQELVDSVRRQIRHEAEDDIARQISEEQTALIETETTRGVELDRLDVTFALEGRLELNSETVNSLLRPGDTLSLYFESDNNGRPERVKNVCRFMWQEDQHTGELGWIVDGNRKGWQVQELVISRLPEHRFLDIYSLAPNFQTGKLIPMAGVLVKDTRVSVAWDNKAETLDLLTIERRSYQSTGYKYNQRSGYYEGFSKPQPMRLAAIDFGLRTIDFLK